MCLVPSPPSKLHRLARIASSFLRITCTEYASNFILILLARPDLIVLNEGTNDGSNDIVVPMTDVRFLFV
jgi:hypothetical protein